MPELYGIEYKTIRLIYQPKYENYTPKHSLKNDNDFHDILYSMADMIDKTSNLDLLFHIPSQIDMSHYGVTSYHNAINPWIYKFDIDDVLRLIDSNIAYQILNKKQQILNAKYKILGDIANIVKSARNI